MRAVACVEIGAPAPLVWAEVVDPSRYLHFMSGITRWEVVGEQRTGVGALPDAHADRLGRGRRTHRGGRVARLERPGLDLGDRGRPAWPLAPATGHGRLDLTPRTRVELHLAYGVAGAGIFGWLAEQLAAPAVRGHLRRSLWQLKRRVEHEQLRAQAAERRAARAAGVRL